VVEGVPKDRYYLFGKVELWIDAESWIGAWNRKYSWKGEAVNTYQVYGYLNHPAPTASGGTEWFWSAQTIWQCAESLKYNRATLVGLRARGFENVTVIEPNPDRRELALKLGAPHAFGLEDVHEAVLGAFGGTPPEVVIECAGHVSAPGLAVELIAAEGTIALVGMLDEPVPISQLNVMLKEAVIRGSFAYRPRGFDEAIEMLASGAVPVDDLVTSRHPIEDAAACFEELLKPGTGELKILLQPGL